MGEPWVVIETSARGGAVGLALDGELAAEVALDPARRHNRDLAPAVAGLLAAHGLRPADLHGVMVGVGPGSYTGLRVGVTSAKALAWATGCRLVAVPTFAAIAERAPPDADPLAVVADALRGRVYAQTFRRTAGRWRPADDLRIVAAEAWAAAAAGWATGPGLELVDGLLAAGVRRVPAGQRLPTAEAVFRAGLGVPPATPAEFAALEPLYLRGSSAEEQAAGR